MSSGKSNGVGPSGSSVILKGIDSVRGIIAQGLERQFVEQGIVGQPLAIRKRDQGYTVYSIEIYTFTKKDAPEYYFTNHKQPEAPVTFWMPRNIPKRIWDLAVTKFSSGRTLAFNIKKYLLSQYDSILDLFSYNQLRDIVTQAFLDGDILTQPIRIVNQAAYYFDSDQVYKKDTGERWKNIGKVRSLWHCREIDMRVFSKAASRFQEGYILRDCVDLVLKTDLCPTSVQYSPLERLVTRVGPVSYERVPENQNPKTFDRVRVQANLSHTFYATWEELRQGVKRHRKEIDNLVIETIRNDPKFQKFGVPVNVLRLSNLILARSYFLEYIFELKEVNFPD